MLNVDYLNRPSAQQVLAHPWFTNHLGMKSVDAPVLTAALEHLKTFNATRKM
jgi:hypothetical protein